MERSACGLPGWSAAAFLGQLTVLICICKSPQLLKFNQWATISTDDLREMNRLRSNKRLSVQTVLDWEAEDSSRNKYIVVQKLLSLIRSYLFIFAFISNILGGGS